MRRLAAALSLSLPLLAACAQPPDTVRETRLIMGTVVQFTVHGADEARARKAIRAAAREMRRVDDHFTIYGGADNPVQRFNAAPPGATVDLGAEISRLLERSLAVREQSGNAFSPLLGSLDLLWGFSLDEPPHTVPRAEAIGTALAGSRREQIERIDQTHWRRLHPGLKLDFGAIAKGYAIDRGVAVLRRHGIENAIVNAGGDLRAIGAKGEQPWRIGIRHPRRPGEVLGTLRVRGDTSIVTSGDYERFFVREGVRYHHILDPDTGRPARRAQSATVVAESAELADAWSTALFVRGAAGLAAIGERGMRGLVVDADGELHAGPGFGERFRPAE